MSLYSPPPQISEMQMLEGIRQAALGGGGGGGTVTSVGFTGGLISVATATTTPALTVAGTSGGIPYFDSASTWATSAALAASALLIGGGVGAAPSSTTTGTGVLTALGVNVGSAGAFVTNNVANTFTALQTTSLSALGTSTAPGHSLINPTAAAAGAQQYSPGTVWQGSGWKTNATAASQTVAYRAHVQTVQGSSAPYGVWTLQQSIDGGAYAGGLEYSVSGLGVPNYGRLTVRASNSAHSYSWNVGGDTASVEQRFNDTCYNVWNSSSHIIVGPSGAFAFASTAGDSIRSTADTFLVRDAANVLAARNGTTAQAFRVYGTYTDASNYVRASLSATSTTATLAAETAGTGADDIDLALTPAGTGLLKFGAHSAWGAEVISGYITIKDSGGTSRKLAVIS